jgi:hypothetical protein
MLPLTIEAHQVGNLACDGTSDKAPSQGRSMFEPQQLEDCTGLIGRPAVSRLPRSGDRFAGSALALH